MKYMNNTEDSTDKSTTVFVICDEQYCRQLQTSSHCHSVINNAADSTDTLLSFCDEQHEHYGIQCRQTAVLLLSDDMTVRTTQTMLETACMTRASVRLRRTHGFLT